MFNKIQRVSFLFVLTLLSVSLFSQAKDVRKSEMEGLDSNYILTMADFVNGRLYLSRKYTNLILSKPNGKSALNYNPNTTLNFGVGVTVKSLTLNLAYGFRFLNEEQGKGKTKYLDLQTHLYKRRYVIDVSSQIYSGLFLENTKKFNSSYEDNFYLRPDINVKLFGVSMLKVYNWKRFSYSAPFVQNEVQQRSSGSFLLGAKASVLFSDADSAYVPFFATDSIYGNFRNAKRFSAIQAGPNIGYAYSLILAKRFFITASVNIAFMIGPVKYESTTGEERDEWQLNPTFTPRLAVGYNSRKWYLGLTFLQDGTQLQGTDEISQTSVGAGNVRFTFVKRYRIGKKLKQQLDKLPL